MINERISGNMGIRWKQYISMITVIVMLTGCSKGQNGNNNANANNANASADTGINSSVSSDDRAGIIGDMLLSTASKIIVDREFTDRDSRAEYDDAKATHIELNGDDIKVEGNGVVVENSKLTINDEGIYVVKGQLSDGQIIVDADDNDKIQIVLDGVDITCSSNAPLYIKNADKVFVTLNKDTVNSLTDGLTYVQVDDNNVDGVIFSKADLTLNGEGTLNINGNYKHGILSKDDIVITGGIYNITAIKDGMNGKDCVKILDGTFTISVTEGNGIQSKNDEDETRGYVYIAGGQFDIVKCQEGIEGTAIIIEGGIINISSMDDGLNSASGVSSTTINKAVNIMEMPEVDNDMKIPGGDNGNDVTGGTSNVRRGGFGGDFGGGGEFGGGGFSNNTNCYISISGGTVNIDASGDGIDSNGKLYISGGDIYVSGPSNSGNGGLDYNDTAEITGGVVVVTSSAGMAQGFSNTSTQYSILYTLTTASAAGTEVKLTDADGKVLVSYIPNKKYQSIVISAPEISKNATYTLTSGRQTYDITITDMVTSNGAQGMMNPGGRGNKENWGQQW